MAGRNRSRWRAVIPALLLALNVWSAAGVPVFHAETEVLVSQRAIESGHSDRCAVLHLESRCTVSTMHLSVVTMARDLAVGRQRVSTSLPTYTPDRFDSRFAHSANSVRAPPVA